MKAIADMTIEEMAAEIRTYEFRKDKGYAFVSYSHLDRMKVYPLVLAWMRAGYNIYIDLDFERHGSDSNWVDLMSANLARRKCRLGICFKSVHYTYSYAALLELLTMRGNVVSERHGGKLFVDAIALEDIPADSEVPLELHEWYERQFDRLSRSMGGRFLGQNQREREALREGLADWLNDPATNAGPNRTADGLMNNLEGAYADGCQELFPYIAQLVKDWFSSQDLNGNDYSVDSSMEIRCARFDEVRVERVREPVRREAAPVPNVPEADPRPEVLAESAAQKEPKPMEPEAAVQKEARPVEPEAAVQKEAKSMEPENAGTGFECSGGVLVRYSGPGGEVVLPAGVRAIGKAAFKHHKTLTGVTLPAGVEEIGPFAFDGCVNLARVELPDTVVKIGQYAFWECRSLEEIGLPEGLSEIAPYAFYGCRTLRRMHLPPKVTKIRRSAFDGCTALTDLVLPAGIIEIGDDAFSRCERLTLHVAVGVQSQYVESYARSCGIPCMVDVSAGEPEPEGPEDIETLDPEGPEKTEKMELEGPEDIEEPEPGAPEFEIDGDVLVKYNGPGGEVVIPAGIREIGHSAFGSCRALTGVTIPAGVTEISGFAFQECSNLTYVDIPDTVTKIGNYAFWKCRKLKDIILPPNLTEIAPSTFYECAGLTQLRIPARVTRIGEDAFEYCTGLEVVTIPEGVTKIEKSVFWDCTALKTVTIPASVVEIGDYAFTGCHQLTIYTPAGSYAQQYAEEEDIPWETVGSVKVEPTAAGEEPVIDAEEPKEKRTAPEASPAQAVPTETGKTSGFSYEQLHEWELFFGLTITPDGVLKQYQGAHKKVEIPEGVWKIDDNAFGKASFLTELVIPESVTEIGRSAFQDCKRLTQIILPQSLTEIRSHMFSGCTGLTRMELPEGVTEIGRGAFSGCTALTRVALPKSLRAIRAYAFEACGALTQITLPEGLQTLEKYAFAGCAGLKAVTIPYGVEELGMYAFSGCTGLTCVDLKKGVASIQELAFSNCTALEKVHVPVSVTDIGAESFKGCPKLVIQTSRRAYAWKYAKKRRIKLQESGVNSSYVHSRRFNW